MTSKAKATADTAADAASEERKPLPVPAGGWPADEFTGLGGDYVRDPYTGLRRRADAPADSSKSTDADTTGTA